MSTIPENLPSDTMAAVQYLCGLERLSPDDMKLLILLEASGEVMYEALAKAVGSQEAQELLRKTGREEVGHAHRMQRVIKLVTGEEFEIPSLQENPYGVVPEFPPLSPEVMAIIRTTESDGGAQYKAWADHEPNDEAAALLRRNGVEEEQHAERAEKIIEILKARV